MKINCQNCADQYYTCCPIYNYKTGKACESGKRLDKIIKNGYPCFCMFTGVCRTSNRKDEWDNIITTYH